MEREMTMKTKIKELRARYNLTQEDLAKKVGVRRETILFIEGGITTPPSSWRMTLRKRCRRPLTRSSVSMIHEATYDAY
jgi:putative transcriptional regulator